MKANNFRINILIILFGNMLLANTKVYATDRTLNEKPNIIFFIVDDMGWMDCGINGSQYYQTPNIDRLAKQGIRFTNAYTASPLCSPTRASIMTGKYPDRFNLTMPVAHNTPNANEDLMKKNAVAWQKVVCPGSRTFMPLEEFTIAEALKTAGYATAHIGKWHLGQEDYWPEKQGFDINIGGGNYAAPADYFSPYDNAVLKDGPDKEYITDRLTDEALHYLETHKDTTFYLNFWHFAVHAPYQGHMDIIKKYEQIKDPQGKQDFPIMGAMIESVDKSLGRLLDKLDELKLTDKTLIIFFSDNGGNMYDLIEGTTATNNAPLRSGKGNIHEGGIRVPCFIAWTRKIKQSRISEQMIGSVDFYPTLLEIIGLKARKNQVIDGISLCPLLFENKPLKKRELYCHFPHYIVATDNYPSTSVRSGDWKLIRVYGEGENQTPGYELYNLRNDIGEKENLAVNYPDKVKRLDRLITKHLKETKGIIPVANPDYVPGTPNHMGRKPIWQTDKFPSY